MLANMIKIVLFVWLMLFAALSGVVAINLTEEAYKENSEVIHEGIAKVFD